MPTKPLLLLPPQSPAPRAESWTARLSRRSIGALQPSEGTAMAKGILIAAMDFSNVAEDEFNDWYDTEHIPERQRVPGFLVCQRWIGADNPKQSVATYDLENVSVLQGPGYLAIGGENLSPWSKRVTGGRDRVQRLVRHRARPRTRSRSGSAVRAPLPHRRREPEIRGALSPGLTSSG
jgi:hypothetical protein